MKFLILFLLLHYINVLSQTTAPFLINTYTNGDQTNHSFSILNNSNIFSVWQSYGQNGSQNKSDIYASIYDKEGIKIKDEFLVTDSLFEDDTNPNCSKLSNGNVVLTWTRGGLTGKIMAKIYNDAGEVVKDEFIINDSLFTFLTDANNSFCLGLLNGNYILAHSYWGTYDSIRVVLLNPLNQIIKSFKFQTNSWSSDKKIRLAELNNNIIIVYEQYDQNDVGIFFRIVNTSNLTLSDEMQANVEFLDYQVQPDVINLANGTFVISWRMDLSDSSFTYCRIFNSSGNPITNEIKSKYETGSFMTARLVQNRADNFSLIYGNYDTWNGNKIYSKELTLNGGVSFADFELFSFSNSFFNYEIKKYNNDFLFLAFESLDSSERGIFGVFVSSIPTFVDSENRLSKYSLSQNYPNPFNPSTTIEYSVQATDNIQIYIYNSLGQLIRTLVNETKSPGEYSVIWNGKDDSGSLVASGAYFYQIQTKDFVSSKKMILIK